MPDRSPQIHVTAMTTVLNPYVGALGSLPENTSRA